MSKPSNRLLSIQKRIGGDLKISNGGVPHLVLEKDGIPASVCYFGRSDVYRVFTTYMQFSSPQTKIDFNTPEQVIEYFSNA